MKGAGDFNETKEMQKNTKWSCFGWNRCSFLIKYSGLKFNTNGNDCRCNVPYDNRSFFWIHFLTVSTLQKITKFSMVIAKYLP